MRTILTQFNLGANFGRFKRMTLAKLNLGEKFGMFKGMTLAQFIFGAKSGRIKRMTLANFNLGEKSGMFKRMTLAQFIFTPALFKEKAEILLYPQSIRPSSGRPSVWPSVHPFVRTSVCNVTPLLLDHLS